MMSSTCLRFHCPTEPTSWRVRKPTAAAPMPPGPAVGRLCRSTAGNHEAKERRSRLVVGDAVVDAHAVGQHALVHPARLADSGGDDRGRSPASSASSSSGEKLVGHKDILHGFNLAVISGEDANHLLFGDVEGNFDALVIGGGAGDARHDGSGETAEGIALLRILAVPAKKPRSSRATSFTPSRQMTSSRRISASWP